MLKPSLIDITIGANLCRQRTLRGVSLDALGQEIGVSYQQIQRYESGQTRISCGTLYRMSRVLDCTIDDLFADLVDKNWVSMPSAYDPSRRRDLSLSQAIARIPDRRVREAVQHLVAALSKAGKRAS